ncbi:hypothetical protein AGMMS49545_09030 [Betaproteobacteria bacterium]|nr:hypothetical protein AGMMS49545_09030 [Betaproteobacteria bacterium]GHU43983.1 hypothetical protein AGMMS50289_11370 [Betaproteobacteria bacterium]
MNDVVLSIEREMQAAERGQRALAHCLANGEETQRVQIFDAQNQARQLELPTSVMKMLAEILSELASGHAVRIMPVHAELSTQEAADILNVSRPYLVKLLDGGEIAHHKTGKHRRVRYEDLMAYKTMRDRQSEAALTELAKQAQELHMGYE